MPDLPIPSLTILVGMPAAGKSTYAARHFHPSEIVSIDACRQMVGSGDHRDWEAHELFYQWIGCRLRTDCRTVVDATCLQPYKRRRLREMARRHGVPCYAVLLDTETDAAKARNRKRQHPINEADYAGCERKWRQALIDVPAEGYSGVFTV